MWPAVCLSKLSSVIVVVVISSSCINISQQQSASPSEQFNRFRKPNRNNANLQNDSNRKKLLNPGEDLIFITTPKTTSEPISQATSADTSKPTSKSFPDSLVFVNNKPVVPTMVPFMNSATTPTPEFEDCFSKCPTTSEFNPICADNRQQYGNEQKFKCAVHCGAGIKIVRRGSCEGLFPVSRG